MALQVWLPLNGNLNNYGASGLIPVQSTAPTYVNGKVTSKAMSTGALYLPAAGVAKFYNNNAMSWAFWLYPTGSGTSQIIGQSSMAAGDNRMFTIFQYNNATSIHLSWQGEAQNNATFLSGMWGNVLTANTWNHVAVTYDGTTARIYVNAVQVGTATGTSPRTNFSYNVPIPSVAIRYLNDFRIYDHVLSIKEIRELSKGLCLHYALDNNGYGMPNLLKNTNKGTSGWGWSSSGGSRTVTALSDGVGVRLESVTAGSSWSVLGYQDGNLKNTIVAGKSYVVSVDCRCSYVTTLNCTILDGNGQNSMTNNVSANRSTVAGQWVHLVWKLTANSSFTVSNQEIYITNASLTAGVYFEFRNIKMEEGTSDTPWCPHTSDTSYAIFNINGNKEIDISGYGYHGTRVGTLTFNSDVPRYSVATLFGSGLGIYCTPTPVQKADGDPLTVSCWFKQTDRSGYQELVCNRDGNYNWMLYTHTTDGSIQFHGDAQYKSSVIPTLNVWHHVVAVVYTNQTYSLYLDGTKVINATTYKYHAATSNHLCIGKYGANTTCNEPFKGYISDVRIYATSLSDDDIRKLYQASAEIDSNGTMYASDFTEV